MTTPPTLDDVFHSLPARLDPDAADGLTAVYQFDLSGKQGGLYYLTIDGGACSLGLGVHPDPHVTLMMSGEDALKILSGQMSGQAAAMSGRVTISGDMGLALQLKGLFPSIGA